MSGRFNEALFDCAAECAFRRMNRRCRNEFRGDNCGNCKYYIGRYVDADPHHMELFMLSAEQYAGSIKATSGHHHFVFIVLITICLFLGYHGYKSYEATKASLNNRAPVPLAQAVIRNIQNSPVVPQTIGANAERSTNRTRVETIAPSNSATSRQIMETLRLVARDLNNGVDVNRDRLINCIDAAVLFYQYYPDKNNIRIYVNRNPRTGMHHLFNLVYLDGTWRGIEPQAVWNGHRSVFVTDIWGRQYDHTLNRNATQEWIRYVK